MRRATLLIVALTAVGLVTATWLPTNVDAQSNNKPIKIKVKCPKTNNPDKPNQGKFSIDIDQLVVEVEPGQGIEWQLDTDNQGNDWVEVAARNPDDWLYQDKEARGQKHVVMTNMVDQTPGKSYEYNIKVYCANDEAVVLDPRIRVKGG